MRHASARMAPARRDRPPARPKLTLTPAGQFVRLDLPAAPAGQEILHAGAVSHDARGADSTPEQVIWQESSRVSLDGVTKLRDASTLLPGGISGVGCGGGHCGC